MPNANGSFLASLFSLFSLFVALGSALLAAGGPAGPGAWAWAALRFSISISTCVRVCV